MPLAGMVITLYEASQGDSRILLIAFGSLGLNHPKLGWYIWITPPTNSSPAISKREIRKLQIGIFTGKYEGPDVLTTPPLLCAYGAYILAETLERNDYVYQVNIESAQKAHNGEPFDPKSTAGWYVAAAMLHDGVVPLELGYVLKQTLWETIILDSTDTVVNLMELTIPNVTLSNGAEDLLEKLTLGVNFLRCKLEHSANRVRQIKQSLIPNLKTIARMYDPSMVVEGGGVRNSVRIRQEFSESVKWISDLWSKEAELAHAHKLAMHQSIRFGTYK